MPFLTSWSVYCSRICKTRYTWPIVIIAFLDNDPILLKRQQRLICVSGGQVLWLLMLRWDETTSGDPDWCRRPYAVTLLTAPAIKTRTTAPEAHLLNGLCKLCVHPGRWHDIPMMGQLVVNWIMWWRCTDWYSEAYGKYRKTWTAGSIGN